MSQMYYIYSLQFIVEIFCDMSWCMFTWHMMHYIGLISKYCTTNMY